MGHFNISDSNQLKALAEASRETGLPVIVGLSEGEREYFPLVEARALVDAYKKEGVELYLNADHTYSLEKAKEAIDAGVDSIVVDGAKLSMEDNITMVAAVEAYARKKSFFGFFEKTVVEGELGYIGTSSKPLESLPEGVDTENLTSVADAQKLIAATGIDCFAPAVGNVHGMLKHAAEPRLHPEQVKKISDATGLPLVLHGASGNTEDDIRACIKAGVAIVHINTELRSLYKESLTEELSKTEEVAPYKFLGPAEQKMKEFVAGKLRVFSGQ